MIQITCGTCGTSQGYKTQADGPLTLPAAEERRLVARGVADYITRPILNEPPSQAPTGGQEGNPDETSAEVMRLERMQKVDLEQMAADMGVDISAAKTKHDMAVLIAAAGELDDDAVLPDLDAGDIVQ